MPPRLRFAVDLSHQSWARATDRPTAVSDTISIARVAEAAGIDSLWLSEDPEGWDAFAVLGALARATTRIKLGPGVANPYHRHPNLLAASLATLDHLSEGRAFLGLGRGQPEWYTRALGMDTGNPLAVLAETFGLLRDWWQPPHTASSRDPNVGEPAPHFRVQDWERSIHPIQATPPIYLAAVGPKALTLAGRLADGVLFNDLSSVEFLQEAIASVRAAATDADRDPLALRFFLRAGLTVTDNPEPIWERKKAYVALINTLPGMQRGMQTAAFDVPAIMAEVRRLMRTDETLATGGGFPALRRAGDLAAARAAIPTSLVAHLALVGPLEMVRDRLAHLAEIGVTDVFVAPPAPAISSEEFAATLRSLEHG